MEMPRGFWNTSFPFKRTRGPEVTSRRSAASSSVHARGSVGLRFLRQVSSAASLSALAFRSLSPDTRPLGAPAYARPGSEFGLRSRPALVTYFRRRPGSLEYCVTRRGGGGRPSGGDGTLPCAVLGGQRTPAPVRDNSTMARFPRFLTHRSGCRVEVDRIHRATRSGA